MAMTALREAASGGIGKFILFGLLVLAVAGMALMDSGGFFRGGTGSNNVLKVAGETVSIQSFDGQARRQLSPIGISPQDAYKAGYMDQIIAGNIREILMHKLADQSSIAISQERLAQHIKDLIAPLANEEQSPQDILRQILRNQGVSEDQFSKSIALEIKNGLISNTLNASVAAENTLLTDALYQFQNETRSIEYLKFLDTEIKVDTPSEEEMREAYEDSKETYLIPETRTIEVITIDDSEILKDLALEAEEILDQKYELADQLEDLSAEGLSLDEIEKQVPIKRLRIKHLNSTGQSHNKDTAKIFTDNATDITQTSFDLNEGELSAVQEFTSGELAAIYVETVHPESYHPFDKVKQQIETSMIKDAQQQSGRNRAFDVRETITSDENINITSYAKDNKRTRRTGEKLSREATTERFNAQGTNAIFGAKPDDFIIFDIGGGNILARVTSIDFPEITEETRKKDDYKTMSTTLLTSEKTERMNTLLEALNDKYPTKVNGRLLERVYGAESETY